VSVESTKKIAIAGAFAGPHIGGSLKRAALARGWKVVALDSAGVQSANRVLAALAYRFFDKRPWGIAGYSRAVVATCARERPDVLIVTGTAPVPARALKRIQNLGVVTLNYSTDDPWSHFSQSRWHIRALQAYDVVCTTRRANVDDFAAIGCRHVHYLPFGYDEFLVGGAERPKAVHKNEVLFVGGADRDRAVFISEFLRYFPAVSLVGAYWDHYPAVARHWRGSLPPEEVRLLTEAAGVNVCLIRRANRDGHVMRSYEVAAMGGCMAVEDTPEHRAIFGEDGDCVRYFSTPKELADVVRTLLADATLRARLSGAVKQRILSGRNAYGDRLVQMIAFVEEYRASVTARSV
jgi:hypothetical protein